MWLPTLFFALVACYQCAEGMHWRPKISLDAVTLQNALQNHIVNGSEAPPHYFKYQVGLDIVRDNSNAIRCGGALIAERWVLTAGHCIQMYPDEKFSYANVLLGAHLRDHRDEHRQVIRGEQAFMHPGWSDWYKRDNGNSDIALIKLEKPAKLNDYVATVRLPNEEEKSKDFVNWPGRVSGWGRTENLSSSDELRYNNVRIVSNEECEEKIESGLFSDSNICTSGEEGKGLGPGDSGGPLVVYGRDGKPFVVGVCSFISGWGKGRPAAYTRVTKYVDWIQDTINNNS